MGQGRRQLATGLPVLAGPDAGLDPAQKAAQMKPAKAQGHAGKIDKIRRPHPRLLQIISQNGHFAMGDFIENPTL